MPTASAQQKTPVVAIMGHIDHGKSTLLDYIRKTNVVAGEAGGITQHLSAYEIDIPYQGSQRKITFLDTPGHAAFTGMRERGASAADIAVLVVSAEDGVKAQTIEALQTIRAAKLPFIVAINKIDRPAANIDKTKLSLAEHEVLVEGYGGDIPWVPISALVGTGVSDLLETILLVADLENLAFDPTADAEGIVIESRMDPKRGISGTVIIKNGTLKKGQTIVAGHSLASTRIMENFLGKNVDSAVAGTAVQLVGFDELPSAGADVLAFDKKRDAEAFALEQKTKKVTTKQVVVDENTRVVPIIIKADVLGTSEAIEKEIKKISIDHIYPKIIRSAIGAISEADLKLAQSDKDTIILGFHVALDAQARSLNETLGITVETFDIIYKLTEWLAEELERRRPRQLTRTVVGKARVLKFFSKTKERQVIGIKIEEGILHQGNQVSLVRRDFPLATGTIVELQQAKQKVKELADGEGGMLVECKTDIAPGDTIEAFQMIEK
jgi:translation initiation factor IF-2